VDNVAAGIINNAFLEEEATTPETESADDVRESNPERHEDHPSGEVHAAQESTSHNDHGDCGENELKVNHGGKRIGGSDVGGGDNGLLQFIVHGHNWTRFAK